MMSVMKLVDSGSRHGHNLCISWWSALWNPSVGHHPLPQTQRQTPDIYIHFGSRKNNCLEHMWALLPRMTQRRSSSTIHICVYQMLVLQMARDFFIFIFSFFFFFFSFAGLVHFGEFICSYHHHKNGLWYSNINKRNFVFTSLCVTLIHWGFVLSVCFFFRFCQMLIAVGIQQRWWSRWRDGGLIEIKTPVASGGDPIAIAVWMSIFALIVDYVRPI